MIDNLKHFTPDGLLEINFFKERIKNNEDLFPQIFIKQQF